MYQCQTHCAPCFRRALHGVTLAAAERGATEVLRLTPGSAQAYSALGFIYGLRGEWSKAEARFRRALAIDPTDPRVHHLYAIHLVHVGQLRLAQAEVSEAFRLAPAGR